MTGYGRSDALDSQAAANLRASAGPAKPASRQVRGLNGADRLRGGRADGIVFGGNGRPSSTRSRHLVQLLECIDWVVGDYVPSSGS